VDKGEQLPTRVYQVTRADLVRYAGASLDFNPIHWSDRVAAEVGLPGVIAHGMYTMALAGRALVDWAGAPDAVTDFSVRFTRPVVVPADGAAEVQVTGVVRDLPGPDQAQVDLTVTCGGERVLGAARATMRTCLGKQGANPYTGRPWGE